MLYSNIYLQLLIKHRNILLFLQLYVIIYVHYVVKRIEVTITNVTYIYSYIVAYSSSTVTSPRSVAIKVCEGTLRKAFSFEW